MRRGKLIDQREHFGFDFFRAAILGERVEALRVKFRRRERERAKRVGAGAQRDVAFGDAKMRALAIGAIELER